VTLKYLTPYPCQLNPKKSKPSTSFEKRISLLKLIYKLILQNTKMKKKKSVRG